MDQARLYEDHTGVGAIGIDGTSRKGHRCITVLADPARRDEEGLTGLRLETPA